MQEVKDLFYYATHTAKDFVVPLPSTCNESASTREDGACGHDDDAGGEHQRRAATHQLPPGPAAHRRRTGAHGTGRHCFRCAAGCAGRRCGCRRQALLPRKSGVPRLCRWQAVAPLGYRGTTDGWCCQHQGHRDSDHAFSQVQDRRRRGNHQHRHPPQRDGRLGHCRQRHSLDMGHALTRHEDQLPHGTP